MNVMTDEKVHIEKCVLIVRTDSQFSLGSGISFDPVPPISAVLEIAS